MTINVQEMRGLARSIILAVYPSAPTVCNGVIGGLVGSPHPAVAGAASGKNGIATSISFPSARRIV